MTAVVAWRRGERFGFGLGWAMQGRTIPSWLGPAQCNWVSLFRLAAAIVRGRSYRRTHSQVPEDSLGDRRKGVVKGRGGRGGGRGQI